MNDIKRDPAAASASEIHVEAAHSVMTTDTQDSADSVGMATASGIATPDAPDSDHAVVHAVSDAVVPVPVDKRRTPTGPVNEATKKSARRGGEKTAKRAVKQEAKHDVKQLTKLQSKPQTKKTAKATKALKTVPAPVKATDKPSLEHADKKVSKQAPKQEAKTSKSKPTSPSVARKATTQNDDKAKRAKKDKVIRDSFTMPKADYDKIATLKARCQANGTAIKKSELLRAGILLLDTLDPNALLSAVGAVETVKTGRPRRA